MTEDHPIDYVEFEGIIPEGNYGAGAMIVWDQGTYRQLEPFEAGFEKGKLLFELRGHKLRGVWTLFRTKRGEDNEWLLVKKPDGASTRAGATAPDERSIFSGLTVEGLRDAAALAASLRERLASDGVPTGSPNAADLRPMLAQTRPDPFTDEDWLFELKYDGYRLIAAGPPDRRPGSSVELRYRSGRDATALYPEVARGVSSLPFASLVLDGEVVVLDENARPSFQRLQRRAWRGGTRPKDILRNSLQYPATYYAFDLLFVEGHDLRGLPLETRKSILREIVPRVGPVRYTDHIVGRGEDLFEQVANLDLEGIMAKRAASTYASGRTPAWLKIRRDQSDEFWIVGWTDPDGTRTGFGALHVATPVDGGLTYAGRVGSGFDEKLLTDLRAKLETLEVPAPPCENPPTAEGSRWVRPELVCEIRYKERTEEGQLRHPVFLGLRDDKYGPPPSDDADPGDPAIQGGEPQQPDLHDAAASASREVVVTNRDKVFWPEAGHTKGDLLDYYEAISPWLLPYLRDRPLVLTRYPDGIAGKSFFQKNAPPHVPDWIRRETMWSEHAEREIDYFICDDVETLLYVINMGSIPLHVWGSRVATLQHPDWCILDLDPKGAPFAHVIRIARSIKSLCDEIDLPCLPKTSGSTGLHVLIPLGGQCTFEQCRTLGQIIARIIVERLPDISTIARSMERRKGRVYIDFLQNGHGRLLVAPFSVRPLPGAPVSMPIRWSEVNKSLQNGKYTITNAPRRLSRMKGDPLAPVLDLRPDLPAVLAALARKMDD